MVEKRASKHYQSFIETFIFYQSIFNGTGDLNSILNLPYPLYRDIILAQVKEKKRERDMESKIVKTVQTKIGKPRKK